MKAIIFARISDTKQEVGLSKKEQVEKCEAYCADNDLEVMDTISITESSTRGARVKFNELLDFIEGQKETIAVIVDCVDRFQRTFDASSRIYDMIKKKKVMELHFRREGLALTPDTDDMLFLQWDFSVLGAKFNLITMKKHMQKGIEQARSAGAWVHLPPLGYRNSGRVNKLPYIIFDEERAPLMKRVFEEYSSGLYTLSEIAKSAYDWGLRSRKGGKVGKGAIYGMILNPFYCGVMRETGFSDREHIHPRIIDKALWNRCQEVLAGKKKTHFKWGEKPYVFRGLITCGHCGCMVTSGTIKKKSGKAYTYLGCTRYKPCEQKAIREDDALNMLACEVFDKLHLDPRFLEDLKGAIRETVEAENGAYLVQATKLRKNYEDSKQERKKLIEGWTKGLIAQEDFTDMSNALTARQEEVKRLLDSYDQKDEKFLELLENLVSVFFGAKDLFHGLKVEQKRELIDLLLFNLTLKDQKLGYTLREPLATVLKLSNRLQWCG